MNIINADKGPILVGSGYVYACLASEFTDNMDVADMEELGYIQEGSPISLTRTHENKEINTENYGTVAITASNYKDECVLSRSNPQKQKENSSYSDMEFPFFGKGHPIPWFG